LGRGIAIALADGGFDVVIGYGGQPDAAAATASDVRVRGRRAEVVCGDVAEAATAKLLLDAAVALGGLGAWVNNAGVSVLAPVVETSPAEFTRMLDVNVVGVLHGLQAAARWFQSQPDSDSESESQSASAACGGRIVNIASDLGVSAAPHLGAYSATKFAVVGLSQAAALELAPLGVTVNAVCPGTAETDMVLAERASEAELCSLSPEEVRASYLRAVPAGRFCTPADVGATVAWLCSPAAAYVTGQAICVNGGSVLH
ncbi:MAG TPA: SDR family oxidoreductase, partial [Acidimicrobiales bacterium]|nr:SDR family oxidoreductase [Acidimicrobiales bacterium]